MNENLLYVLKRAFDDNAYESVAQRVELDRDVTRTGVNALIPTVLASLLGKNTVAMNNQPTWWQRLENDFGLDQDILPLNRIDDPMFATHRESILGHIFGSNRDNITSTFGNLLNTTSAKAESFIGITAPLIMGYLTNWMKRKGLNFGNLVSNLFDSRNSIISALPPGITPAMFGISNDFNNRTTVNEPRPEQKRVDPAPKKNNWLWIPLLLIAALLLWWLLGKGCNREKTEVIKTGNDTAVVVTDTNATIKGALNDAGDWIYEVGQDIKLALKDGKELTVGEYSTENRLVTFINGNAPVDKTTWFSLDRFYFDTGKSTLKAESKRQLENLAEILKAYPNVNLKIGGYTDSTGDNNFNMKLSQERANVAMAELVKLGIDKKRLEAEGYGSQHPVATNDTPEGRAQNRRIDVRVTQK